MGKKMNLTMSTRLEELSAKTKTKDEVKSNPRTASLREAHPELVDEWDWEKNEKTPDEHIKGKEICWWICPECNYSWNCSLIQRRNGRRCPVCHSHKPVSGYSDFATRCSDLMEAWDWDKNNQIPISPYQIGIGTSQKIWLKCSKCGYEWQRCVCVLVKRPICPQCKYNYMPNGYSSL